jgi:Protein of unknown function (DUF2938)
VIPLAHAHPTGVEPLDPRLLARWIGHMGRGRLTHPSIADADPVSGEARLGIVAHHGLGLYLTGRALEAA